MIDAMERSDLIRKVRKYFELWELVSPSVYNFRGELAWGEFDTRLLETLLVLRTEILKVPMIVNNWKSGGTLTQRGFRENTCQLIKDKTMAGKLYMTPHVGMAVDFSSPKLTPDQLRDAIVKNANKLPHRIRLEAAKSAPTWVHLDVRVDDFGKDKITWFG